VAPSIAFPRYHHSDCSVPIYIISLTSLNYISNKIDRHILTKKTKPNDNKLLLKTYTTLAGEIGPVKLCSLSWLCRARPKPDWKVSIACQVIVLSLSTSICLSVICTMRICSCWDVAARWRLCLIYLLRLEKTYFRNPRFAQLFDFSPRGFPCRHLLRISMFEFPYWHITPPTKIKLYLS